MASSHAPSVIFTSRPTTRTSLLAAYGVFAVGFLMRPLGAVLFGHIGDRVGRGPALLWSVVAMAVPTLHHRRASDLCRRSVSAASVLMLLCRMMQGLAVGGEYTSSAVFLAETAEPDKRGAASAWAPFGAVAGILLGSAVGALVLNILPLEQVVCLGLAHTLHASACWWASRASSSATHAVRQARGDEGSRSSGVAGASAWRCCRRWRSAWSTPIAFYLIYVYHHRLAEARRRSRCAHGTADQLAQHGRC